MLSTIKDESAFNEAINSSTLSVIHFQADWVEQCIEINDVLDTLSKHKDYSNSVKFYSCSAENLSEISIKYNIEAVPAVLIFQSGKNLDRVDGADAAKITEIVKKHNKFESNELNLKDRLKSLINKSTIMLFMKGDRTTPRCGFSRQIIEILNNLSVPYETFDILQDEEIRQGLKTYSDWPTYPQLYVKGELIGGLDIVKEMLASGDLQTTLKC